MSDEPEPTGPLDLRYRNEPLERFMLTTRSPWGSSAEAAFDTETADWKSQLTLGSRRRLRIALTPLIDVIFILLLFFMLSTSINQDRQIDIATTVQSKPIEQQEIRKIILESDSGEVRFDGRLYDLNEPADVVALVDTDPLIVYTLGVLDGVHTQAVVTTLDTLKTAGAARVSLARSAE